MTVAAFLNAYFWIMAVYLGISVAAKLFKSRKLSSEGISLGMWIEEVAGYALLVIGLLGVYGHVHATAFLGATFWQGFVVALGLFSALQYFMPKTQYLRRSTSKKTVFAVFVVGVLLLIPMFFALVSYGFMSPNVWLQV